MGFAGKKKIDRVVKPGNYFCQCPDIVKNEISPFVG
jgi:hypothetical protein